MCFVYVIRLDWTGLDWIEVRFLVFCLSMGDLVFMVGLGWVRLEMAVLDRSTERERERESVCVCGRKERKERTGRGVNKDFLS